MLLTKRILYVVAFDGIEAQVSDQVASISKALGVSVYLLAVMPTRYDFWRTADGEDVRAREKLAGVAQRLSEKHAHIGRTLVVRGNRAVAAMEAAQRLQCEFIIIGAGEQSLDTPEFIRTTAKALARSCDQNVWICKPHADVTLQHIVCAFNASPGSAAGIHVSIDLARQFAATMQLLSALPTPPPGITGGDEIERDEAQEAAKRALFAQREGLIEGFNFCGISVERDLCWSQLASVAVLERAQNNPNGLLVMGAAGRNRFPVMMLGNTAEKILHGCRSSLLVVK